MAKVFIEETTLTAIGDAIRGKEGTTALVPVTDMATRITDLQTGSDPVIKSLEITSNGTYTATDCDGYSPITVNVPQDGAPTDEELTITGNCTYRFALGGWDWFIDKYANRITTKDISRCTNMFNTIQREEVPFDINVKDCESFSLMFAYSSNITKIPNIRGTIKWTLGPTDFSSMFSNNYYVRSLENVFTPEMLNSFSEVKITNPYSCYKACSFQGNTSLRQVPSWWYKFRLNPESTSFPAATYCLYYSMLYMCYSLDEITNIPVWKCQGAQTGNMFSSTFNDCKRAKNITFETNPDGTPIEVNWKSQTIDLSRFVGYTDNESHILNYNSGITADKKITDDATYQALKNDPDWFTTNSAYSRYNHDSAVATINSLPDTSAYLATAGGTNTIKFKGTAGSLTDGGAINTLTEEEIAVATAKGWTVTLE